MLKKWPIDVNSWLFTESNWSAKDFCMNANELKFQISSNAAQLLQNYGFDSPTFKYLRDELISGRFPLTRNQIIDPVEPLHPSDVINWPAPGSALETACIERGRSAIERGEVAVAILNGGMATRFGGGVKGIVEVLPGQSFLQLKLQEIARHNAPVPVFVMNSFATDAATRAHAADKHHFGIAPDLLHFVHQNISIRLTPEGDVFRDEHGEVSLYAPGHGDLLSALARHSSFKEFVARGGKMIAVSNVDNLAATLSPKVIGLHMHYRQPVTVEVAPRAADDKGGAPARVNGRVEVLEGFRFPSHFDIASIPVFNTNTFVLNVNAVRADYPLTWFRVDKEVGGRKMVQFERLLGEITAFQPAAYIEVPRTGSEGRFLPVKTPDDLQTIRTLLHP